MGSNENQSEVARLRQQIEAEYAAAQRGLTGVAVTAKHAFISKRMENIGACQQQLAELVGEQEATGFVYQVFSEQEG